MTHTSFQIYHSTHKELCRAIASAITYRFTIRADVVVCSLTSGAYDIVLTTQPDGKLIVRISRFIASMEQAIRDTVV